MAKHNRKATQAKPISRHPLFAVVVALWFGALFGLGSLAVRPTLFEDLVLRLHLDLVVPSAAPPLGITARILIALAMAALGAVLGILAARRITRPKPQPYERKRTGRSFDFGDEDEELSHGQSSFGRSEFSNVFAQLEDEPDAPEGSVGSPGLRRRALAIEDEEREFIPQDFAPLPGGAPQVLDIADIAMAPAIGEAGSAAEARVAANTPERETEVEISYEAAAGAGENNETSFVPPPPLSLALGNDEPVEKVEAPFAPRQVDEMSPLEAGRQVFGEAASPSMANAPRQIFGQSANDDHEEPAVPAFEHAPDQAATTPVTALAEPVPETPVAGALAPEAAPALPPLENPAALGMADLAERLAQSMRRRRAQREAAGAQIAPPVPQAETPASTLPPAAGSALDQAAVPPATSPRLPASAPEAIAPPLATAPQEAAPAPAPGQLPKAMQPLDLDSFLEDDDAGLGEHPSLRRITMPPPASVEPPQVQSLAHQAEPAPVDQDECEDDDTASESYASLLEVAPPRQLFVRVEEPVRGEALPEPVVIFPGQSAPLAQGGPTPQQGGSFRRFDAPTSAEAGQQVAADPGSPQVDKDQADQALRAALANLQKMGNLS